MNERDVRDIRDAGRQPVSPLSIGLYLEPDDEQYRGPDAWDAGPLPDARERNEPLEYEAHWSESEAMREDDDEPD